MKNLFTFFLFSFIALSALAQVPQKFSYQTVVRNASNQLLIGQTVGIKISILQGSANGSAVYAETHAPQTNANGLATLEIGGGALLSGNFANINWANGSFFVKIETDPNGGNNYTITNTSQLLSVPYALYATTAGNNTPGPQGPAGPQGPQGPVGATGATGPSGNPASDDQNLSVSATGDTLFLQNGGFVIIPGISAANNGGGGVLPITLWTNPITGSNPGLTNPYTTGDVVTGNISVSGIGRSGVTGIPANDRYNSSNWPTGVIDVSKYFELTLTPNNGYSISFNSFIYTGQISSGSATLTMRSSIDGYSGNIGSPTAIGTTISLTDAAFQNINVPITFRIYANALDLNTTTYSINDFSFLGHVNLNGGQTGITTHSCGATNVHNPAKTYGTMTDQQGNMYKTIVIGTQEWMAENLKTTIYRNGEAIANVIDDAQWTGLTTGAWDFYNYETQYDCPYGKLYNWYAVTDPRHVCPTGWHEPTDEEWTTLTDYLGGEVFAGEKMKSTGTQYWLSPNNDATNESGFSGLPAGSRYNSEAFVSYTANGVWWSSSDYDTNSTWARWLFFSNSDALKCTFLKRYGLSVRCLRD